MALAIRFDDLIRRGEVRDYADLARLGHVSRARITQIMNLLNLAPDIQERLLFGTETGGRGLRICQRPACDSCCGLSIGTGSGLRGGE